LPCRYRYHDRFARSPVLFLPDQRTRDDPDQVADEGEDGCERDQIQISLLRLGIFMADSFLYEAVSRIGRGQRLASRTWGGGFGDITSRSRCDDSADSEGSQEGDRHAD
jgi:hypothetical protein